VLGNDNGTQTWYLVRANTPAATAEVLGLVDTLLDPEGDGTTIIPCIADLDILEIVGLSDGDAGDHNYDGAQVLGPDGSFTPAGIFRGGDFPSPWCNLFLDFDPMVNAAEPRTPGAMNSPCVDPTGPCDCAGEFASNYCPLTPNSAGPGTSMSASGSDSFAANNLVIEASGGPAGQPGVFYYGPAQIQVPFGEGNRCVGGSVVRLWPPSIADGTGFTSRVVDNTHPAIAGSPSPIVAGGTMNFQYWHRDPMGGGTGFNLSDAISILFTP